MFYDKKPGDKFRRARAGLMREGKAVMERSHLLGMKRVEDDPHTATAATDGIHLFVNVPWIETMEQHEIQFVLMHEARHRMLKHPLRMDEWVKEAATIYSGISIANLWKIANVAADYRINDDLIQDGWKPPKNGCFDNGKYRGWSVKRIFHDLLKQTQKSGQAPEEPKWGNCSGLPGEGKPGEKPSSKGAKEAGVSEKRQFEQEISEQNETAMRMAKKRGLVPGSMKDFIKEGSAPDDWTKSLPAVMSRIRGGDDFSMARISNSARRMRMVMPGLIGMTLEHVVIGIDTSGSISVGDLSKYLVKINSIIRVENPVRVTIIQVDARVQDVKEMAEGETLPTISVKGRGGTAFQPLFDHVADQGWTPDCVVYLTDGDGDRPLEPDYPVVWLTTRSDPAGWGTVINI